jgi:AraC-like DNA-binding protein
MVGLNPEAVGGGHQGKVLQHIEVAGLLLSRSVYPPELQLRPHVHANPFFSLVLGGGFTEIGRRDRMECGRSALLYRAPDEEHANHFHRTGAECFRVEIGPSWGVHDQLRLQGLRNSAWLQGGPAAWLVLRLADECKQIDDCSSLVVQGLVLETLGTLARMRHHANESRVPTWLSTARDILRDSFAEPFDAAAIAAEVGVHPVHLSRAFRRQYGRTMGDYLRQIRVAYAGDELARSDRPIACIALDAGFSGQSHFSVAFKRVTGMSPAQYRASFGDAKQAKTR